MYTDHDAGFEYVTAQWLAARLRNIQRDTPWADLESADEPASVDVRLQVAHGDAVVHSGDASFDTDHYGYWGASYIERDDDWSRLVQIARDMIELAYQSRAEYPIHE